MQTQFASVARLSKPCAGVKGAKSPLEKESEGMRK